MANKGVVILFSYYEAIRPLPDDQRLLMYDTILDFALSGAEPDLPPLLAGYFALIRPNIEASMRKYEAAVRNGAKGGRPKENQTKNQIENQSINQTLNQTPNHEKEKEKDLENDLEKEREREMEREYEGEEKHRRYAPSLSGEQEYSNLRREKIMQLMKWDG